MERLKKAMLVTILPIYSEQTISTFDKENFMMPLKLVCELAWINSI